MPTVIGHIVDCYMHYLSKQVNHDIIVHIRPKECWWLYL